MGPCPASGSRTSTSTCLTFATRWPPTCLLTSPTTPLSPVIPSAPSSSARSRCSQSAARRPRPSCMHQDIKNKVESNFGPMEDILQETQLTEHEFFPLVMQLLHGKEMDYMTGGM